jgi:hypothetical protein
VDKKWLVVFANDLTGKCDLKIPSLRFAGKRFEALRTCGRFGLHDDVGARATTFLYTAAGLVIKNWH